MSTDRMSCFPLIAVAAGMIAILAIEAAPASAQCEQPPHPSCITCHADQAHGDAYGAWHKIHGRAELCVNCHGGNGSATDKNQAHSGMFANPLSDIYTNCHACHPADYREGAAEFAATLQVTPASCATPTPVGISKVAGGPPPGSIVQSRPLTITSSAQPLILVTGGLAMLTLFFLSLGWLERHQLER
jgi:hypothetical protein